MRNKELRFVLLWDFCLCNCTFLLFVEFVQYINNCVMVLSELIVNIFLIHLFFNYDNPGKKYNL